MSRAKFHTLTVSDVRLETHDCVSVAFDVPADLKADYGFKQGQYLTLRATIGGEDMRRSYSICSGVDQGELRVAVKKVERGVFSTWVNDHLKKGDSLQVMTPTGNFSPEIALGQKKSYLLVGAGSGITPLISIAKSVLSTELQSEVTLIYGNRHFHSIIFRDELEDMKDRYLGRFRVFHILSGEPNEISLFHGRIDGQRIEGFTKTFIDLSKTNEVFICGPEPMIRSVKDFVYSKGMTEEQVHFELFATPGASPENIRPVAKEVVQPTGEKCQVSIVFDGQQVDFEMPMDGTVILDAAQNHGMDIPFSCKGGMCCTCRAHLDEGQVQMEVNYALEPGEVENGFILTCQSRPLTSRVVVDFDKQ